jgi:hypothetical protein
MTKPILLALCLLAPAFTPLFSQQPTLPRQMRFLGGAAPPAATPAPNLTKFNLDFPGGTPSALVDAIEKASHIPLNAIIPTEYADAQLPPLKMNNVNVVDLFAALESATTKDVPEFQPGSANVFYEHVDCGFQTGPGDVSDDSVWYFHDTEKQSSYCRFYSLAPYLDRGFTVDDITTAIHTGWEMQADSASHPETSLPKLFFHKETKLLIAVGDVGNLQMIDQALNALPATSVTFNDITNMKDGITALQTKLVQLQNKLDKLPDGAGRRPGEGVDRPSPPAGGNLDQ